jgi:hypothetical protein
VLAAIPNGIGTLHALPEVNGSSSSAVSGLNIGVVMSVYGGEGV